MRLAMVLALLVASGFAQTANASDPVFDRLVKTHMYAFGRVGFAATITQGEKDYKTISLRPTALADFERLFAAGTPEAKAYALVGIHELSPEKFEELSRPLRNSKIELMTAQGCILSQTWLSSVIEGLKQSSSVPKTSPTPYVHE